jgi:hypothetical protein
LLTKIGPLRSARVDQFGIPAGSVVVPAVGAGVIVEAGKGSSKARLWNLFAVPVPHNARCGVAEFGGAHVVLCFECPDEPNARVLAAPPRTDAPAAAVDPCDFRAWETAAVR